MKNLLQFDEQFDTQLRGIESAPWASLRLVMLKSLHEAIVENLQKNQQLSYLTQIKPLIVDALQNIGEQPTLDPVILEWCYHHAIKKVDGFSDEIAKTIASAYFRLGAFDKLTLFLNHVNNLELAIDIPYNSLHIQQEVFIEKVGAHLTPDLIDTLQKNVFNRQFASSHTTVKGLFVIQKGEFSLGMVAKIGYERAVASEKLALDQVRIATHLVDESDVLSEQTQSVCKYLHKKFNHNSDTHVRLEFTLDQPSSLLVGSSTGLAFALLGQMGLHMYKSNRTFQPRIYSDIAFTGAIDETGNILPVSEQSLKYKIEAAFFGGIRTVIVPKSQVNNAENEVANLQQRYPNRKLEILPLGNMVEFEERRDILHHQRRKVSSRISQFAKDYANSVTYSIMAFILLICAGFWFGVVKHPVPDKIDIERFDNADFAFIKNKFGYILWKSDKYCTNSELVDINNDGNIEILLGYGSLSEKTNNLVCYTDRGEELWSTKLGKEMKFGNQNYPNKFAIAQIYVHDFDHDSQFEIVVSATNNYFPCEVSVLDSKGNEISSYWNSGHLFTFLSADIYNNNDYDELLVAGTNNEGRQGVLIVLDPFIMSGFSPQDKPEYTAAEAAPGNQLYYLRFPPSPFNNKSIGGTFGETFKHISTTENEIYCNLFSPISISYIGNQINIINYSFSYQLELEFSDYTDSYNRYFAKSENDMKYPGIPNYNYVGNKDQIDYWDGEKWVREATINRYYLK